MKVTRPISSGTASVLGYLLLLMAFAALGLFVVALAMGSGLAAIFGIALISCLAGSVARFRAASRSLARSGVLAEATSPVSIFSTPLRRHQIDRYLENYRGASALAAPPIRPALVMSAVPARRTRTEHSTPALLSA